MKHLKDTLGIELNGLGDLDSFAPPKYAKKRMDAIKNFASDNP